jgi:hypothetical protein
MQWTELQYGLIHTVVDYTVKNSENLEGISCENKNVGAVWLIGCGVAHTVARRLSVRQARVRISARHPRGGTLPSGSHEDIKRVLGE